MTVINMLSLGEEGIAVADEQSSTPLRKYNVAEKLHILNGSAIYGGSGISDMIKEVYEISNDELGKIKEEKKEVSLNDIYHLTNNVLINYKNHLKNNVLRANISYDLDDFLTGHLSRANKPLDESSKNYAAGLLKDIDEKTSMVALIGGKESGKFNIYEITSNGFSFKSSRPYASIGSGEDESGKVLSSYVSHLPRNKRENIDKTEGLSKIIEATNASSRLNVGVGGAPSIMYFGKEIIIPNENQCILATEIVEGLTNNFLEKDIAHEYLSRLIFDNENFQKIEEEIKTKLGKDWEKLNKVLRGYKE